MTKDEALNYALQLVSNLRTHSWTVADTQFVISAIKEALAQPEQECKSSEPKARRPDVHCHDKTCGFLGECRLGYKPEQEPVAWISHKELLVMRGNAYAGAKDWRVNLGLEPQEGDVGLYTTPPQRTWVGLTDEDIRSQWSGFWVAECHPWAIEFARAIEAKLKEKNT